MPARNELLADHFIKATGIAAVYADARGAIGAADTIGLDAPIGCVMLCCARGKEAAIVGKASGRLGGVMDQAGALALIRTVAADAGIGLTPHESYPKGICSPRLGERPDRRNAEIRRPEGPEPRFQERARC
jgi:hypothetical protein